MRGLAQCRRVSRRWFPSPRCVRPRSARGHLARCRRRRGSRPVVGLSGNLDRPVPLRVARAWTGYRDVDGRAGTGRHDGSGPGCRRGAGSTRRGGACPGVPHVLPLRLGTATAPRAEVGRPRLAGRWLRYHRRVGALTCPPPGGCEERAPVAAGRRGHRRGSRVGRGGHPRPSHSTVLGRPSVGASWRGSPWASGSRIAATVSVIRERTLRHLLVDGLPGGLSTVDGGLGVVAAAAATGIGWGVTALIGLSRQPIAVAPSSPAAAAALSPLLAAPAHRGRCPLRAELGRSGVRARSPGRCSGGTTGPLRGRVFDLPGRFAPVVAVEGESGCDSLSAPTIEIGTAHALRTGHDLDTMTRDAVAGGGAGPRPPPRWPGRTVLDVGANIGRPSCPLLALYPADRGAVEPAPENAEMLRLNLGAHRPDRAGGYRTEAL